MSEKRKQLVFLGAKPIGYHCFQYLLSVQDALNIEIAGVLTHQRAEFGGENDLSFIARESGIQVFEDLAQVPECDILYSIQYHEILKQPTIDKARQIAVNLHMAPLPEYRGCNQFSFAIIDDKKEFGTTIHQIDTGIDHGAILFQKRFAIPENCWVNDLYELTYEASLALFKESLNDLVNENYTLIPQESMVAQCGTSIHYRKEITGIKTIDLNWDAAKIDRHIRATAMPGFEPPFTMVGNQKMYFTPAAK